jgi:tRNA/tmRNA/rRNA uracil-C5-methylase (TrmA/RlmC/RlmD family)
LIDAYAGVGLFGLSCGHLVQKLYLIENDLSAMRAARQNGARLGFEHVVYVPDRVETGLAASLDCVADPALTMCLLDPPRSGCSEKVLSTVLASGVGRLVYISCAPDHLARDARRLNGEGYELVSLTPFDMFPQTAHIEVVSCWEKRC